MDKNLPKQCIITIGYLKGISKRDIIADGWFEVENTSGERHFAVEK